MSDYDGLDCDDYNANVFASDSIEEGVADGLDQNCDGQGIYVDNDGDGWYY